MRFQVLSVFTFWLYCRRHIFYVYILCLFIYQRIFIITVMRTYHHDLIQIEFYENK